MPGSDGLVHAFGGNQPSAKEDAGRSGRFFHWQIVDESGEPMNSVTIESYGDQLLAHVSR